MMVNVIGIGKAFKMDLEDVLVRAEVRYHTTQRDWATLVSLTHFHFSFLNIFRITIQSIDMIREHAGPLLAHAHWHSRCHCGFGW